jgi:hypothetical protein
MGYLICRGYVKRKQISNYLKLYDESLEAIDIKYWYEQWNDRNSKSTYETTIKGDSFKKIPKDLLENPSNLKRIENQTPFTIKYSFGFEEPPKEIPSFELILQKNKKSLEFYNNN